MITFHENTQIPDPALKGIRPFLKRVKDFYHEKTFAVQTEANICQREDGMIECVIYVTQPIILRPEWNMPPAVLVDVNTRRTFAQRLLSFVTLQFEGETGWKIEGCFSVPDYPTASYTRMPEMATFLNQ